MNEKKGRPSVKESPMKPPSEAITRNASFGTIVADFATCAIDNQRQVCTITFLQQHPIPKQDSKGVYLDGIETEMRLEVKMPLESAYGLAFFITGIWEQIRAEGRKPRKLFFGPTYISEGEKEK